jgi:hypothetical protein
MLCFGALVPRSVTSQKRLCDGERLWKELGLEITPHQFRHAAAYIMLKADPGNYELVRRVLGHRSSATTRNFYIGLKSLEATRIFGDIVTGLIKYEASPLASPKDAPCLKRSAPNLSPNGRELTGTLGKRPAWRHGVYGRVALLVA